MCWAASASPLIAVTATGVFCKLSVRRCAVTMISATLPLSEAGAAKESVDCPLAAGATRANKSTVAAPASDSGKVAEIIVTAQRRTESLQNTPVAVTAISGDALAAQHIDNVSNISAVTPSVNFQSTNNAQATANLEIRGIGTVGNNRAFEGSVGVFVDGVYLSRAGQLLSNFLDFDSLQVLRGPQGTLFGKNTTAGALLITSASPQFDRYDGSYEVTVGNYGAVLARVASTFQCRTPSRCALPPSSATWTGTLKTQTAETATTTIVRAPSRHKRCLSRIPL